MHFTSWEKPFKRFDHDLFFRVNIKSPIPRYSLKWADINAVLRQSPSCSGTASAMAEWPLKIIFKRYLLKTVVHQSLWRRWVVWGCSSGKRCTFPGGEGAVVMGGRGWNEGVSCIFFNRNFHVQCFHRIFVLLSLSSGQMGKGVSAFSSLKPENMF